MQSKSQLACFLSLPGDFKLCQLSNHMLPLAAPQSMVWHWVVQSLEFQSRVVPSRLGPCSRLGTDLSQLLQEVGATNFSLGHPSNVLPPRGSPGTTILHARSHSLKLAICTGMLEVLYKTGLSKGLLGKGGDCHEKDHGSGQEGSPEKLMKQRLLNNLLG